MSEERKGKFEAGVDAIAAKVDEQETVMAENFSDAADKVADALDAAKERKEERKCKFEAGVDALAAKIDEQETIMAENFSDAADKVAGVIDAAKEKIAEVRENLK